MIPMKLQIFADGGAGAGTIGNGGDKGADNPGGTDPKPVSFDDFLKWGITENGVVFA